MKGLHKAIFASLLIFAAYNVQAQDTAKAIENIRKTYNAAKTKIDGLKKAGRTAAIYAMCLEDNVFGGSYPAYDGIYNKKQWFYYEINDDEPQLIMVIETTKAAAGNTYSEYLYIDGSLAFAYEKSSFSNNIEKRLYRSGGKIILYSENNKERKDADAEEDKVMLDKTAFLTQQLFEVIMNQD